MFTLYEDDFGFFNDAFNPFFNEQFLFTDYSGTTNSGQIIYESQPYEAVDASGNLINNEMFEADIAYNTENDSSSGILRVSL